MRQSREPMNVTTKTWSSPVLRWAGSKRSLVPELAAQFRTTSPRGRYIEPFAGSACLFFALRPGAAVLGDLNVELMETYRCLRDHPRLLARAVAEWGQDRESYYLVRGLSPEEMKPIPRAARFLYLNRLCFNGVYRTNRAGHFNVPYGTRTGRLPSERQLYRCSVALRQAELRDGDFDRTTSDIGPGDFVYLDPPYTQDPSSAYGVYGYGSFDSGALDRVLAALCRIDDAGATFVFSYADVAGVREAARPHWTLQEVEVPGRIAAATTSRKTRREILLSNCAPVGARG
jgi:DNA adenine methylase